MRLDWIGWIATAVFASSYLFKQPLLCVIYGSIIHAFPVVVAN